MSSGQDSAVRYRAAFTLTELMVTLGLGSGLLVLAVGMLHRTMDLTASSGRMASEHRTIGRLADTFRVDVREATTATVEASTRVRLESAGGDETTFEVEGGRCVRTVRSGGELRSEELFELLPAAEIAFESLASGRRIGFTVHRGSARVSVPERPATLRVEAVVGLFVEPGAVKRDPDAAKRDPEEAER